MTIQIKVTNEDSRDSAVVEVKTLSRGHKTLMPIVNRPGEQLKGGESITKYIHDGESVLVEEVQNG